MNYPLDVCTNSEIGTSDSIKKGDILFVDRGLYKHYGIYAGNGMVIHYSDKNSNFGTDIKIQEASLDDFASGFEVKVCQLDEKKYTLYSGEETLKRAYSRLDEKNYNLIFNNCEHFAVWCKTGISDSDQVNKIIRTAVVLSIGALAYTVIKKIIEDK